MLPPEGDVTGRARVPRPAHIEALIFVGFVGVENPRHRPEECVESFAFPDLVGADGGALDLHDGPVWGNDVGAVPAEDDLTAFGWCVRLPGQLPCAHRLGPWIAVLAAGVRPMPRHDRAALADDGCRAGGAGAGVARGGGRACRGLSVGEDHDAPQLGW